MTQGLPERIAKKIAVDPETDCWLWIAATDKHGYGRVNWGGHGKSKFAHRLVYMLLKADPGDLPLDHLCRVHGCVNPDHLEPVTHAVNVRRGQGGTSARQRYANHLWCPQGHPLFGPNLYVSKTKAGHTNKHCRICGRERSRRYKARKAALCALSVSDKAT